MKRVFLSYLVALSTASLKASEHVVLLHGLARSSSSMNKLEGTLKREGYRVSNPGYPSRRHCIEELSAMVREKIEGERRKGETLHIVTHSLGGIIIRQIQKADPMNDLGRVVMLSPPNQGSELVDKLGGLQLFRLLNGPAGNQLGTASDGFVASLGRPNFELGVITGDRTVNPILSLLIPGRDDGKVSIESAAIDGMKAFKIIHATHTFIMRNREAHSDIIQFLRRGAFIVGE